MANRIGRSRSRRSGAYMAMAAAAASILVSSAVARADTTDELIDQLKAKGILTKAEYAKLKHRRQAEVAAKAAAQRTPSVPASNGRYVTALDKGIGFHIPGQQIVSKDNGVVTSATSISRSPAASSSSARRISSPPSVAPRAFL